MDTIVVGGGPAALGLLSAAMMSADGLEPLLSGGRMTIVSSGPRQRFGAGRLGGYLVRSDTRGHVIAEALAWMNRPSGSRAAELFAQFQTEDPVPLQAAGRLLALAGQQLLERLEADPRIALLSGARLVSLRPQGERSSLTLRVGGRRETHAAARVVLALGGRPAVPAELEGFGLGVRHSDAVLRAHGLRGLLDTLSVRSPRVLIVGGSHSAFAVAGLLLRSPVAWPQGGITVAHRSTIRVTYADVQSARAQGISVMAEDICPSTGLVNRFGGLRGDSAALFARIRSGGEPRVQLEHIPRGENLLRDLVRPGVPVTAATGSGSPAPGVLAELRPATDTTVQPRWDDLGRLRDAAGEVVPGVYGLGLGTHRMRGPGTGGEPAFNGSIDGVWFYQHVVAPALLRLLES